MWMSCRCNYKEKVRVDSYALGLPPIRKKVVELMKIETADFEMKSYSIRILFSKAEENIRTLTELILAQREEEKLAKYT
jgi:hypothetical protein